MQALPEHLKSEAEAIKYLSEILKTHGENFYEEFSKRKEDETLDTSLSLLHHESPLVIRIIADMIKHFALKDATIGHYFVDHYNLVEVLVTLLKDDSRKFSWGHYLDALCILTGDCGSRPDDIDITTPKYKQLHTKSCNMILNEDFLKLTQHLFETFLTHSDQDEWLESEMNNTVDPLHLLSEEDRQEEEEAYEPSPNAVFSFAIAQIYLNIGHHPNLTEEQYRLVVPYTTQMFMQLTPDYPTELQMWSTSLTRLFELAGLTNHGFGDILVELCCRFNPSQKDVDGTKEPECPLIDYIFKLITEPYQYPENQPSKLTKDPEISEEDRAFQLQENQMYMNWVATTILLMLLRQSSNPHFNAILISEHMDYFKAIFHKDRFNIQPFLDLSKEAQEILGQLQQKDLELQQRAMKSHELRIRHRATTKKDEPEEEDKKPPQKNQKSGAKGKGGKNAKKTAAAAKKDEPKHEPLTEEELEFLTKEDEELSKLFMELQRDSGLKQAELDKRQSKYEPLQIMMASELYHHILICNLLLTNVDAAAVLEDDDTKANKKRQKKNTSQQKSLLDHPNLRRGAQSTKVNPNDDKDNSDEPEDNMEYILLRRPNQLIILQQLFPNLGEVDTKPYQLTEGDEHNYNPTQDAQQNYFTLVTKGIALLPFLRDEESFRASQETISDAWQCVMNILQYGQFFLATSQPQFRLEEFKKKNDEGEDVLNTPYTTEQEEAYKSTVLIDNTNTTDLYTTDPTKLLINPYEEQRARMYNKAKIAAVAALTGNETLDDSVLGGIAKDQVIQQNAIQVLHHFLSNKFITSYSHLLHSKEFFELLRHLLTFTYLGDQTLSSSIFSFIRSYGDYASFVKYHVQKAANADKDKEEEEKEKEADAAAATTDGDDKDSTKKDTTPQPRVELVTLTNVDYLQAVSQYRLCILAGLRSNITLSLLFRPQQEASKELERQQHEILSFYHLALVTTNVLEYNIYPDGEITDEYQRTTLAKYFGDLLPIDQFPSSQAVIDSQRKAIMNEMIEQQKKAEQQARLIMARGTKKQKKELLQMQQQQQAGTTTSTATTDAKKPGARRAKKSALINSALAGANLQMPSGSL